ncbi:MAG: hypothetical protein AAF488_17540, partial [Planctomycetota bacterium]
MTATRVTAAVVTALCISVPAFAGTDGNGFFDTYLVALGYDGPGAVPTVDEAGFDYLCDGEIGEYNIEPEEGSFLVAPLALGDEGDCGGRAAANRGFDENALLDAGELPIRAEAVGNTTLNFNTILRNVTGDQGLEGANSMAYAWVYVTNNTPDPVDLVMGIGSDDSMEVQVN